MNKSTKIILIVAALFFGAFFTWAILHKQSQAPAVDAYDLNSVIQGNDDNGGIADHIEGDPNAPLKIFEYSDYQCSGCASVVDKVGDLIEKYKGKVAVVHRTYVLSYHSNGVAAASATEAAALQGYWKKYGDYLFEKQEEWFYSNSDQRTEQFTEYFKTITDGKGDIEKFLSDMASENVKKKVNFDIALAKRASTISEIQYTPAFFINGEFIDWASNKDENFSFVDHFSSIIDPYLDK